MLRDQFRFLALSAASLTLTAGLIGCAAGFPQLVSISIAPTTATAQDSTKGTVQFVATGTYSDGRTVTPLPALWGFHAPWILIADPAGVTVDSNGLAQCTTYKGTTPIVAIAPINPGMPPSSLTMRTPSMQATAHLTCQ